MRKQMIATIVAVLFWLGVFTFIALYPLKTASGLEKPSEMEGQAVLGAVNDGLPVMDEADMMVYDFIQRHDTIIEQNVYSSAWMDREI